MNILMVYQRAHAVCYAIFKYDGYIFLYVIKNILYVMKSS